MFVYTMTFIVGDVGGGGLRRGTYEGHPSVDHHCRCPRWTPSARRCYHSTLEGNKQFCLLALVNTLKVMSYS